MHVHVRNRSGGIKVSLTCGACKQTEDCSFSHAHGFKTLFLPVSATGSMMCGVVDMLPQPSGFILSSVSYPGSWERHTTMRTKKARVCGGDPRV